MQRVAQRLRRISESLVDFSRVRKTQMEPLAAAAADRRSLGAGGDRREVLAASSS